MQEACGVDEGGDSCGATAPLTSEAGHGREGCRVGEPCQVMPCQPNHAIWVRQVAWVKQVMRMPCEPPCVSEAYQVGAALSNVRV